MAEPQDPIPAGAIAVIGRAGRFPGASSIEAFWANLAAGIDSITDLSDAELASAGVPAELRRDPRYVRAAPVLEGVELFDAAFFGYAPREATLLDPQQRIFLECAWEAMEDAGYRPGGAALGSVGVFAGSGGSVSSYLLACAAAEDLTGATGSLAHLGNDKDFLATRVAFELDLRGPAIGVQTACSSSLVAVHLACQSLLSGECDMALAGGVTVRVPHRAGYLHEEGGIVSPDGRCRPFSADAAGTIFGSGAGIVVLRPLADALAAGDPVRAVLRGSAVNNDGGLKVSYSASSTEGQARAMAEALAIAGVDPATIGYVEAHGTATELGDPVEVAALAQALGRGRRDRRCGLGSVKSNVGHLEAAAGIAGLLKVILALERGSIPPSLHCERPNPRIPFAETPFEVVREATPWPAGPVPRRAAVNALGMGGTNAHVIVEEAPRSARRRAPVDRPLHLMMLSAKSPEALRQAAERMAVRARELAPEELVDAAFTANVGRARFPHHLAVVAGTPGELADRLAAAPEVREAGRPPRIAFLFSGQGSQFAGMGRELYATSPLFRHEIDRFDTVLREGGLTEHSLAAVVRGEVDEATLVATGLAQPALFAVEHALAALWRSWGIEPAAVIGHSVGEYAAACAAGVFSSEEGLALVAERGRLLQSLPAGGGMLTVFAAEEQAAAAIRRWSGLAVAAVNGPESVVVSGPLDALEELASALAADGVETRPLAVSHAFHSPLVEPVLDAFEAVASRVPHRSPRIPLITGLAGEPAAALDSSYWRRQMREPVRFRAAVERAAASGCDAFIEIGPGAGLLGAARRCLPENGFLGLPSLRRGRGDWETLLDSLAALAVRGAAVDWEAFDQPYARRRVALPTYPFERRPYWIGPPRRPLPVAPAEEHPLLGRRLRSPFFAPGQAVFAGSLSVDRLPLLEDHKVWKAVVVPGACHLARVIQAAAALLTPAGGTPPAVAIEEVEFPGAITLAPGESREVHLALEPAGEGRWLFRVLSLASAEPERWTPHVLGKLRRLEPGLPAPVEIAALRTRYPEHLSGDDFYGVMEGREIDLGPRFRWIGELWQDGGGTSLARLLPPAAEEADLRRYALHPSLLDACFQQLIGVISSHALPGSTWVPFALDGLRFYGTPSTLELWSQGQLQMAGSWDEESFRGDVLLCDGQGRPCVEVRGLYLKRAHRRGLLGDLARHHEDWLYEVRWQAAPRAVEDPAPLFLPSAAAVAAPLRQRAAELDREREAGGHARFLAEAEELGAAWAARALRELGSTALEIAPRHRRLLARLQEIVEGSTSEEPAAESWQALGDRFPGNAPELALLERCTRRLPEVLRGACDPLDLLFPGGTFDGTESFYQGSATLRVVHELAAEALTTAAAALPPGRRLRVLEVGAGTGGATACVLPRLPAGVDYVFTDVSRLFLARAEEKLAAFPWVRYELLDLESDPGEQGFAGRTFDVVFASNVLHATSDLRRTLSRVLRLLAPGGLLVAQEATGRQIWLDLVFGLTEGWWGFTDAELRESYPLLPLPRWRDLLLEAGFVEAETVSETVQGDAASRQSLLLARAPGRAAMGSWLVLADAGGVGDALAERLRARGDLCLVVPPEASEELEVRVRDIDGPLRGVVALWGADPAPGATLLTEPAVEDVEAAQALACRGLLRIAQILARREGAPPRLWAITRGVQAVGPEALPPDVAAAPVWGLGKVVAREHPELRCTLVDLDPLPSPDEIPDLLAELLTDGAEDQVALRRGQRQVARLDRAAGGDAASREAAPCRLEIPERGVLDRLALVPWPRRAPGPGEVEIEVAAAGLNFRDVMNALGTYPGEPGPLGLECAGTVTAVGAGVEHLAPGDPVVGLVQGCFAPWVIARADWVVRRPAALGAADAAGVPAAFLTAAWLLRQTPLGPGLRVLVHAGAGGVGLAAVQLARRAGARVYATASPAKQGLLRALGVEEVFDSREPGFGRALRERVDVVLSSLAGDFVRESLDALAPGGWFLEIGKTGILSADEVAALRPDVTYMTFDLLEQARRDPDGLRELLSEMLEEMAAGRLQPFPCRAWPLREAAAAFRHMAQGRHVGKILLLPRPGRGAEPRPDATYLITGGLGGLGLRLAGRLVERGARHLVLAGRSAPSPAAAVLIEQLRSAGAEVTVVAADVARREDVERLIQEIEEHRPPLRGVFHAAGGLDDGVILQQDWSRFTAVMAPKVAGAWNLHRRTRHLDLDWFVLFSSAASLLGSPGQGNHAAANAFLDALAHARRRQGLAALSVNWGAWEEVGAAAGSDLRESMAARGLGSMPPEQALDALEDLLATGAVQTGVTPVSWPRYLARMGPAAALPSFSQLQDCTPAEAPAAVPVPARTVTSEEEILPRLAELPRSERRPHLSAFVRRQIGRVLGLAGETVDGRQPLRELGLDSLMAVELRNRLKQAVGQPLPATLVFKYPTLDALVGYLSAEILGLEEHIEPAALPEAAPAEDPDLAEIQTLSDEEVRNLLAGELREIGEMDALTP
jgi:acyl transferase domain-containing protein/NADPH:quinone reductase-like Zn-dependent oxidoreductase/short-subunit dehydrogenase/acyl carrier protein